MLSSAHLFTVKETNFFFPRTPVCYTSSKSILCSTSRLDRIIHKSGSIIGDFRSNLRIQGSKPLLRLCTELWQTIKSSYYKFTTRTHLGFCCIWTRVMMLSITQLLNTFSSQKPNKSMRLTLILPHFFPIISTHSISTVIALNQLSALSFTFHISSTDLNFISFDERS